MMKQQHDGHRESITELPRIPIPPDDPVTSEDIEQRRRLVEEAFSIRDALGPLGFSVVDLIRQARDDDDAAE